MDERATLPELHGSVGDVGSGGVRPTVLARDIYVVTAVAVVVRGLIWIVSLFIVGPVAGTSTAGLMNTNLGKFAPLITESALAGIALAIAIAVAIGVRRGQARWRRRA